MEVNIRIGEKIMCLNDLGSKTLIKKIIEVIKNDKVVMVKITSIKNSALSLVNNAEYASLQFIVDALKENKIHATATYFNNKDTIIIKAPEFTNEVKKICGYENRNTQITFYKERILDLK